MPPPKPTTRPRPVAADDQAAVSTLSEGSSPAADPNATMIDPGGPPPPPRKPAGGGAKLSATKGPKAGTDFNIGPGETSIGRQGDNTIVIPDISVSRKHVVVRKEGAACILVDQGSGNGTLLNGARVEAETELQDGDVIVMGDTELVFRAPKVAAAPARSASRAAAPAAPARRGPPQQKALARRQVMPEPEESATGETPYDPRADGKARKKKLFMLAGGMVLMIVLLGAIKVRQNKLEAGRAAAAQEEILRRIQEEVDKHAAVGKNATRARDFKAAALAYEKAMKKAGEVDIDEPAWVGRLNDIQRGLSVAKKETANQEIMEEAKDLTKGNQLAAAVAKIKSIPEDSLLTDKVGEAMDDLKKKIPGKIIEGKAALVGKTYEAARLAVADVLAVDPDSVDAKELQKEIDEATKTKPRGPGAPKPPPEDPTSKIIAIFVTGHLDEAIGAATACDDPKCKSLKDKLTSFKSAYDNLDGAGNVEKAVGLLRSIPGGTGTPFMQTVSQKGSSAAVKDGVAAMSADNYPKAFAAFRQVLSVDSSNDIAKTNMSIIHQKASELSEQAYVDMQGDPDKARRELDLIIHITDSGDPINQKARARQKKLAGGGGGD